MDLVRVPFSTCFLGHILLLLAIQAALVQVEFGQKIIRNSGPFVFLFQGLKVFVYPSKEPSWFSLNFLKVLLNKVFLAFALMACPLGA